MSFNFQWQAGDGKDDFIGLRCDPLVEKPGRIAEIPGELVFRHDPRADFIRYDYNWVGLACQNRKQGLACCLPVMSAQHQVGQPKRQTIDQARPLPVRPLQRADKIERFGMGGPFCASPFLVQRDTVRHLSIARLGGGDVDGAWAKGERLCLGNDAFARSGPACDEYRLAHGPVTKQKRRCHERGNTTVERSGATELRLIRHAPALNGGRLCGRTDVDADCSDLALFDRVRRRIGTPARLVVSPAVRCRQTAGALWRDRPHDLDQRLWEQDFGAWEGTPYADLPDLGPLAGDALAAHRPPGGESFVDVCQRIGPAVQEMVAAGDVTVVAHAGTVRAALALAVGPTAALAFEIAPLSVTRLRALPGGGWAIAEVNWTAP